MHSCFNCVLPYGLHFGQKAKSDEFKFLREDQLVILAYIFLYLKISTRMYISNFKDSRHPPPPYHHEMEETFGKYYHMHRTFL